MALGPKDVIPGDNIFGLRQYTVEEVEAGKADFDNDPKVPKDFKILVLPDLYPEFMDDPNWAPYLGFIEPVDYSLSPKKDFTKDDLTYGFMTSPGGILQTSQVVSQDVSWWTAPRIAIEVALLAYSVFSTLTTAASEAEIAAQEALRTASNNYADALAQQAAMKVTQTELQSAITRCSAQDALKAIAGLEGKTLTSIFGPYNPEVFTLATIKEKLLSAKLINEAGVFIAKDAPMNMAQRGEVEVAAFFLNKYLGNALDQWPTILADKLAAKQAAQREMMKIALKMSLKKVPLMVSNLSSSAAACTSLSGYYSSKCWGGSGTYNADNMQKGMRENILSNIHQVSLVGGGYVVTTPTKKIIYHTYIKEVSAKATDVVIYTGFDDDDNSSTSDRTMTCAPKAFRNHKGLKTVRFHAMKDQTSNAAMPMLFTIPDSAFVGCDNLVELNLLLQDNEGGTRPLGPENFILAGDSIFAGLDSLKFHIVIDPSRKQDFLDNASWAPLKRFFTYQEAKPVTKYNEYGGQYAYSYENNSIKRENKVQGHLIEHTIVTGPDNEFLDEHQGALKLCNDIGVYDNYQLDAVTPKAFYGNDRLRVVNFTDLKGTGGFGDSYTGLEMALGDSCFAYCKNLADLDLLYLVTDDNNRIEPIKPEQVKIGDGVLDSTTARIKMMPQQVEWFEADSSWVKYKDRFLPCVIKPADDGIRKALKDMAYYDMAHTGYDPDLWDEYIDLARIGGHPDGFAWLDGKFTAQKDNIRSFAEFKHFESIGLDYVGREWFRGCKDLSNIVLPSTIKTIQPFAFANCYKLQEIELPAAVTEIGDEAFNDGPVLKNIRVLGTMPAKLTGKTQFSRNDGL